MNEQQVLILIDKKDKTFDVEKYEFLKNKVKITFKNSDRVYSYSFSKIIIYSSPVYLDIKNQQILYQNIPLRNVRCVIKFEKWIKVFFQDQQTRIFDLRMIHFNPQSDEPDISVSPMDYWIDISQYTNIEDEQEAYLKKQISGLNVIHHESVLASYLQKNIISDVKKIDSIPRIYPFRFNLSQKKALEQALSHKISIIEGPPGTGKTQTILNILANLTTIHNKTVAVVSGNNAAVQNVKDKLDSQGYGFMVATLGNKNNKMDFFENLPKHQVEGWNCEFDEKQLSEKIGNLSNELDQLLTLVNRKAEVEQMIAAYQLEQKHFQLHNDQQNIDSMEKMFLRTQTANSIISFLADEYFVGDKSYRFLRKAKLLFKYGFVDFKKLKRNRMDLITRLQQRYYETKIEELNNERNKIELKLETKSFENLLKQHEMYSKDLFRKKLFEKYHKKGTYTGNYKNYKSQVEEFMSYYPIMLSTTHALRSCIPDTYLFDCIIVDEASQVDLLTGALAMSCCKQIIIVGDMKQLPQIVDQKIEGKLIHSDVEEVYNYFKHNLLSSVHAIFEDSIPKVMLKEHYRCHPQIIGFCNNQYYDNSLIPMNLVDNSEAPIRLHYTAVGNHMRKVTVGDQQGNFNQREIDVVKEEIIKELQLKNIQLEDIGFTTPYRLQVTEAVNYLDKNIEIDTVHKYQGREKPVMILSTVLDQTRNGQIGKKFVENPSLVNVAVSRAQKQFILVTDHSLFRNSRKDIGNLIRYIEYQTLHEHITYSELISVFDLLYTDFSEKLHDMKARIITKSKYESENIINLVLEDLLKEDSYKCFNFTMQVYLKDVFKNLDKLNESEKSYIRNRASFDFVIYDNINKQPVMAIEVNGFKYHRNNLEQSKRDLLKASICKKYEFELLILPTTGSNEVLKIRNKLDTFI